MANVDPPQPVPPLGPQPDFAFISQALHQVATQFGHIPNLPPFPQGNALMQQMLQMQQQQQQFQQQQQQFQEQVQRQMQQFQQAQQQMQQDITAVRNDIQALRNEVRTSRQATEYNSTARIENSRLRRGDHPLTTFHDYTTNADIPGFPATPIELANMTDAQLDPLLTSLDLSLDGAADAKRQRLRFHIGLENMPQ